jgi:hypothetical protein
MVVIDPDVAEFLLPFISINEHSLVYQGFLTQNIAHKF